MKRQRFQLFVLLCLALLSVHAQDKKPESPWKNAETLFPGIKLIKLEKTEPRLMKIHIVRVDLKDGRYGFFTTPKPAEWGQNMPEENAKDLKIVTRRQSAKAFMKQAHQTKEEGGYGVNMLLAVNASPWIPWKAPWNHKFACHLGLTVLLNGERGATNLAFLTTWMVQPACKWSASSSAAIWMIQA
ncbi:MAG: hypothetical protein IKP58_00565, partial [Victivallales bacterium]|nr:hypothetical protein [Victivallales bacterium]